MLPDKHRWLTWARDIQAIAQMGLTYSENPFDQERYEMLMAIAAEIMSDYAAAPLEQVRDLFAAENGAMTPKVDVRGVVFRDGEILLVKETMDEGRWTLPGGWADVNESPGQAVVREIREESGYETKAIKLLALYDRDLHGHPPIAVHCYKIFFLCELIGGAPTTSHETGGAEFFAEDALPEDLSVGRVTKTQLLRFFEHQRHPDWATDFD